MHYPVEAKGLRGSSFVEYVTDQVPKTMRTAESGPRTSWQVCSGAQRR